MDMTQPADLLVDLETDEVPAEALSDIDVCVSNAGVVDILAPAHSMSHAKWDRDLAINLTGAFRVIQACLRGLRERNYGRSGDRRRRRRRPASGLAGLLASQRQGLTQVGAEHI